MKLMNVLLLGAAFCLSAQHVFAQDEGQAAAEVATTAEAVTSEGEDETPFTDVLPHVETLADETNKISYALGLNTARNLKYNFPDVHVEFFILALRDVLGNEQPKLNEHEINEAIAAYSTIVNKRDRQRAEGISNYNLKMAEKFLEVNGKKDGVVVTDSGLQYRVIAEGNGPAVADASDARITLTTKLLDGRIIESTAAPGRPKSVLITLKDAIPAWQEAIPQMKMGAKWEIYAHPRLAFGEEGGKNIGPNELLIFRIEVVGFQ